MINHVDEIFEKDEEKRKLNLNDGKWQVCNYYTLYGNAEGSGYMRTVTIDKSYVVDEKEVLKYIFLHGLFTYGREGWEIDEPWDSNLFEYWVHDNWGVVKTQFITNTDAYCEYFSIFNQFCLNQSSEFYINGELVNIIDEIFTRNEMVQSVAFYNEWNYMLYFIECSDKWVLFKWFTGA